MEPTDITLKVLQGIREDSRKAEERHEAFQNEIRENFALINRRFEHSEKLLVDITETLAMHTRALKVAIDDRARFMKLFDDHEERIAVIEEHNHP